MSTGLYTQPQFPPTPPTPPQFAAPPKASGGSNFLLSLLMIGGGVLILGSVLVVAGVWYAVSSLEGWMVGLGREGVVAIVNVSQIPDGEKTEVIEQIDRVVAAYKAGDIGSEELDQLMLDMGDTPVIAYISFYGVDEQFIEDTTLPEDEQQALRLVFRRVLYGLTTRKIDVEDFYATMPDEYRYERALATSEEKANDLVRQWSSHLKDLCDDAGIINDPPAVDVGDEMKRLVDELLAGK